MKSLASLLILAAWPAQEPPPGDGPRGSSQVAAGEARFDAVGYAAVTPRPGIAAAVRGLAPGSFAEVTALASGRTILVAVEVGIDDSFATLSPLAAEALGIGAGAAVRVRRVTPSPQDAAALRAGSMASARMDAPEALLAPLRLRLPARSAAVPPPSPPAGVKGVRAFSPERPAAAAGKPAAPAVAAKPVPPSAAAGGYWVQVAALANAANARALAAKVGGTVAPLGSLSRVRVGPLPDRAAADAARARLARAGYPQAVVQNR